MKEANTKGATSDALTEAAKALKDGGKLGEVARQLLTKIREGVGEEGGAETSPARDGDGQTRSGGDAQATGVVDTEGTKQRGRDGDAKSAKGATEGTEQRGTEGRAPDAEVASDGEIDQTPAGEQIRMPGIEAALPPDPKRSNYNFGAATR